MPLATQAAGGGGGGGGAGGGELHQQLHMLQQHYEHQAHILSRHFEQQQRALLEDQQLRIQEYLKVSYVGG